MKTTKLNPVIDAMHSQAKTAKRLMTLSQSTKKLEESGVGGSANPSPFERSKTKQVKELQAKLESRKMAADQEMEWSLKREKERGEEQDEEARAEAEERAQVVAAEHAPRNLGRCSPGVNLFRLPWEDRCFRARFSTFPQGFH